MKSTLSRVAHRKLWSPPVWGRGLKFFAPLELSFEMEVAPCVGAWVEINIVNSISRIQEDNIFTDFRHFLQRKEFVKKTEKLAFVLFLFILGKKSVLYSFV